jgi:hypothetical protein
MLSARDKSSNPLARYSFVPFMGTPLWDCLPSGIKFLNPQNCSSEKAARVSAGGLVDPTLGYPARGPASWRRRSEFSILTDLAGGRFLRSPPWTRVRCNMRSAWNQCAFSAFNPALQQWGPRYMWISFFAISLAVAIGFVVAVTMMQQRPTASV